MTDAARDRNNIFGEIKTAVRHSTVYGLGNVLVKVLGFAMLPFYTHYLSPASYGLLEILDLSMSLLAMVLHMGIAPAFLRRYAAAQSVEEKNTAVSTAFLFICGTGLIVSILGLAFVRPVSALLFGPEVPSLYLLMSFGSFLLSYVASLPRTYLRALEASGAFTAVESISLFAMLGLNIYFIAVLKIGLMGILLSSVIVMGVQALLLSIWTVRAVGIHFSGVQLQSMVTFGLPLIFSNLAIFALNFSDRFFLQHLWSLEVVGIYAVGYKFGFMMNYLLVQPFYAMWQSRMYVIHSKPQHPAIFRQIFMFYSLLLVYAGLALSVLSPEIIRVMAGPQFSSSQDVIPIIVLAYVFYGIGYFVQSGMFLATKTSLLGLVSICAAVLNLGLNYVLILHFGVFGAAWATLLSFIAIAAGSYLVSQRVMPLPLDIKRVAMVVLLGIAGYLLCRWASPESLGAALLTKAFVLAVFPFLLWKMRILSPAELVTVASATDKTRAGVSRLLAFVSGTVVNL
jgi:O-antigen/teichoic acid export membrane protein